MNHASAKGSAVSATWPSAPSSVASPCVSRPSPAKSRKQSASPTMSRGRRQGGALETWGDVTVSAIGDDISLQWADDAGASVGDVGDEDDQREVAKHEEQESPEEQPLPAHVVVLDRA